MPEIQGQQADLLDPGRGLPGREQQADQFERQQGHSPQAAFQKKERTWSKKF